MFLFGAFCLLTLPWLNPFTFGPTPAVVPWLFSMACAGALLGIVGVTTATTAPGMDRQEWVRAIAGAWLVAALISAAIGLVQYFGDSAALTPWVNGTELGEAYGNLRQRNQFATLMAMGLAALVWWVIQGASWRLAVAAAALLAMGSVASSSRTGLLQWLLCIAVATQCGGDRRRGPGPLRPGRQERLGRARGRDGDPPRQHVAADRRAGLCGCDRGSAVAGWAGSNDQWSLGTVA